MSEDETPQGEAELEEKLEEFWTLLEDGDLEDAHELAAELTDDYPGQGEVLLALAAVTFESGEAREALRLAEEASAADCSDTLLALWYQAAAHHSLWESGPARDLCEEILRDDDEFGEGWYLLAQICELQGDEVGAHRGYMRAFQIDPERFVRPARMSDEEFDEALRKARRELPERFQEVLGELLVNWEDLPDEEMARAIGENDEPLPPDLLGLFVGTDRPTRSNLDAIDPPGIIFLFRKNLERVCPDRGSLAEEIQTTLWHELAHYLGFDEDQVAELGLE